MVRSKEPNLPYTKMSHPGFPTINLTATVTEKEGRAARVIQALSPSGLPSSLRGHDHAQHMANQAPR